MKLSIIVPVYNMAADGKLKFCMDSLLAQTARDFEIIAVDDCSADNSWEILQQYEKAHPAIVKAVRSPVNRKQGGARNIGIAMAQGEWIGFIDSDDWAARDMYEKLLRKAEETGADVVGCDYHLVQEHSMEIGKIVHNNTQEQTGLLDDAKYKLLMKKPGSMVIKIYKRAVVEEHGLCFPEDIFYEDNAAAPIWMLHFKHFEMVEEPLYYYYQFAGSTVHHISRQKCEDRMTAAKLLVEACREHGFYEKYYTELEERFTELYYVNTLFTYMVGTERISLAFLRRLAAGIQEEFPDFRDNPAYLSKYDAEQRKLIDLHLKSPALFVLYYKALQTYRAVRCGRKQTPEEQGSQRLNC